MIMWLSMQRFLFLLCLCLLFILERGYAQHESSLLVPTPFIQGVNVITGLVDQNSASLEHYEKYQQGWNQIGAESFFLNEEDFRVGRIKTIHLPLEKTTIHLSYEVGATWVYDIPEHACVYRYSNSSQLLNAVEHHEIDASGKKHLYRCERLFWQDAQPEPRLISRALEDAMGHLIMCYCFFYDRRGQLIRETLVGNLTGSCSIPCVMGEEGYPQLNGAESYSKNYIYSEDHPEQLLAQIEDNGLMTTYHYDASTKQCIAKLKGYSAGLISRCFYSYDSQGFLEKTILDDGQGQKPEDLTNVTQRQIICSQISQQLPLLGQPLKMESSYWDAVQKQEKKIESIVYVYSDLGQLIQQNYYDAQGVFRYDLRFNYDQKGKLLSTVDSREELLLQEDSLSPQEPEKKEEQPLATVDAYGNETTYTYDAFRRLTATCYPIVLDAWDHHYHPIIKQNYNICDQVVQMIDAKGEKTSMRYTIRGQPVEIMYPDGSREGYRYFLDGGLKEKITREGIVFSFIRDQACHVVRSEKYSVSGDLLQSLSYDYQGDKVKTVTDGETFTTHFLYDGIGRQIGSRQHTTEGIRRVEWTYDAEGKKSQIREWFGSDANDFILKSEQNDEKNFPQASFEDAQGEHKYTVGSSSTSNFVFTQTTTVLNGLKQYVKQEEKVDANGIRQVIIYDALQRLENVVKYNAMGIKLAETHFRYDAQGNKVLEKHHVLVEGHPLRLFTIRWNYDACKRLISVIEGADDQIKITRYHYNSRGQVDQVVKPDGTQLLYIYNEQGQLERFEASDHSFAYVYSYDHLQRLVAIHDLCQDSVQRRRYNVFHELIEEQQSLYVKVDHQYDLAGRRIGLTLPDHSSLNYHYQGPLLSTISRLTKEREFSYAHSYSYDEQGDLKTSHLLNKLGDVSYHYNSQKQLTAIDSPWWSQKIGKESLESAGRLLTLTTHDSSGQYASTFHYAEDGQLAEEEGHQYTYDSLFNRISENGQKWEVNTLNQLIRTPTSSCVYDPNGNLVKKQTKNENILYAYDALNRLTRVEYPEQHAFAYVYDAFDRRIKEEKWEWQESEKTWQLASSASFIYDGFKEIGKLNAQGQIVELRILGQGQGAELGAAVALELKGKLFVPLHDFLGSVCCLIEAEKGEVVESYRYSAYGQASLWNEKGESLEHSLVDNPWRFCSKRIEDKTGLIFFGKRDYDPLFGRWMTPDPLPFCDTPNLYAFIKNDPMNCSDLYGLFSITKLWKSTVNNFFSFFYYFQTSAQQAKMKWNAELKLPATICKALERIGKTFLGEPTYLLMGPQFEETYEDHYGEHEISDKVRVTFINGILNTEEMVLQSLQVISESHGGVKIHYVFRPSEGWTWDVTRAIMVKAAFKLGFRSIHAYLLANTWRKLIQEMGGAKEGGVIVHYAHSLGGCETDRARDLLTFEEQAMIRVVTFGSATLVRNVGFQSVINMVSKNDGVSGMILEPIGNIRAFFDPDSNVRFHGSFFNAPYWPTDHLLNGPTYGPIIQQLGEQFLADFSPS